MDIVEELRTDRESGAKRLETEYKAGLMALALRFCNDPGDAEELVNSTFAAVVENVDEFLEQSSLFTWMCKILTSKFTKGIRRKSNQMEVYPGDLPDVADEDAREAIYRNLDASLLREAIDSLPPDIRKTLMMHYFMDFSVKDVSRMLAVPAGTVMWRLHYARQILAAKLGAAAKKPGVKALLIALALATLTAIGAAVVTAVGGNQSAAIDGDQELSTAIGSRLQSAADDNRLQSNAGNRQPTATGDRQETYDLRLSTFDEQSTAQGEDMNLRNTAAALLAATTVATTAAIPAAEGATPPQSAIAITAYSNGFTLDTRPSPQTSYVPIEPFSTLPLSLVIILR